MGKIYNGIYGNEYEIEDKKIAGGGEGQIFKIVGDEESVAKIFKKNKRNEARETKLRRMVEFKLSKDQLEVVTWPQDILYEEGEFVGYIMPKLKDTKDLNKVYSKDNKNIGIREKFLIAINICNAISEVHSINQICGDLNPNNICVNLNINSDNFCHVTLVDTDSYHIKVNDEVYRCGVGLTSYVAPELQKKLANGGNLETIEEPTYTLETDLYAIAVHIFQLLMKGCHPFACAKRNNQNYEHTMKELDGVSAESIVCPMPNENMKNGIFPFVETDELKKRGITYPLYAPDFSSLPTEIQRLFLKTFVDGYDNPKMRTTIEEWKLTLIQVARNYELVLCEKGHEYFKFNKECPYCEVEKRTELIKMQAAAKYAASVIPIPKSEIREKSSIHFAVSNNQYSGNLVNEKKTKNQYGNTANEKSDNKKRIIIGIATMLVTIALIAGDWAYYNFSILKQEKQNLCMDVIETLINEPDETDYINMFQRIEECVFLDTVHYELNSLYDEDPETIASIQKYVNTKLASYEFVNGIELDVSNLYIDISCYDNSDTEEKRFYVELGNVDSDNNLEEYLKIYYNTNEDFDVENNVVISKQ